MVWVAALELSHYIIALVGKTPASDTSSEIEWVTSENPNPRGKHTMLPIARFTIELSYFD